MYGIFYIKTRISNNLQEKLHKLYASLSGITMLNNVKSTQRSVFLVVKISNFG